jgi:hypothetical protein
MKTFNASAYVLVRAGREYSTAEPVDWAEVAQSMERTEAFVYWMQPKTGSVDDQFPCVRVNGAFYTLSQKLEKAVFRNVRLTREFANRELLLDGSAKLRIPLRLLREKMRAACKVCDFAFRLALPCVIRQKHAQRR